MNAELKINCRNCMEDITLDVEIQGKTMPSFKTVMDNAIEQGWKIGRDCYCPDCYSKLPAHCDTCDHFEGNKIMGAYICRRDGKFACPTDYCEHHT